MKPFLFLLISLLISISVFSQDCYDRLYYTCKVWGFVKYFHSETANGSVNLDSVLVQKLPQIEAATGNDEFNQILLDIITSPGETALPTGPPPFIPDSLTYNLDLNWFDDPVFSQTVKDALDTISIRFRPRTHHLVGEAFAGGNPTFGNDIMYNAGSGVYPEQNRRILALFRYWNIINYFYPYKNIIDQNWDTTLVEAIPKFFEAATATDYTLAVMTLEKRINDSHAFTTGGNTASIYGASYPRFACRFLSGQTVITKVHSSVAEVHPGDIIRALDDHAIEFLRDSIESYTKGSNDLAIQYYVHEDMMNGLYGNFNITIENETGWHDLTLSRNFSSVQYYTFQQNTGTVWYDTLINNACTFGYVDMERLTVANVGPMMTDLWNTDAIIFDLRNYPQGTLWYLVDYLFTHPIHIASFTVPDIHYPGILGWLDATIGSNQTEAYEGKVIILFDINTISQAEYTCMGLEQHPGSIKIGNTTMAADGNVSTVALPGYLTVYFTGLGTFYPDYTPTQRIGIIPDIEILPTIEGLRQGRDEVLEYAFNCALVGIEKPLLPENFLTLKPNPAMNAVTITCNNPSATEARITLTDFTGKQLAVIYKGFLSAGLHSFEYHIRDFPPGLYLIRLIDAFGSHTIKLIKS